jgi:DNA end-binding protein Ku
MPRPIWKGAISFGLVTIPVNLYSAVERGESLSFHLLHNRGTALRGALARPQRRPQARAR